MRLFFRLHEKFATGLAGRSADEPENVCWLFPLLGGEGQREGEPKNQLPAQRLWDDTQPVKSEAARNSQLNDRPHPGPFLRGEGESFAASLKVRAIGFAGHSFATFYMKIPSFLRDE
jgi:hypothetical protein